LCDKIILERQATSEQCEQFEQCEEWFFQGKSIRNIYKYSAEGVENNSLINNEHKMRARVAL